MWSVPYTIRLWLMGILIFIIGLWWWFDWTLLGFTNAEVYGHIWSHSWRLEDGLFGTSKTVGTNTFPAIDILPSILVGLAAKIVSLPIAYNLLVIFSVLSMGWMGALLFKQESGDPFVGVVLLTTSPIFWGIINSGLTEDFGVFLVIATAILCLRKNHLVAGVFLGITAYWGLLQSWMSGIVMIVIVLSQRATLIQLIRFGVGVFLTIVPLLWIHSERLFRSGHRTTKALEEFQEPLWMLNPWHHADAASFLWSQSMEYQSSIIRLHPTYIGWIALLVALQSRAWKWWVVFVISVMASLGPTIYWMGQNTEIVNPVVWILSWLPGATLINHHARWMVIGLIGLTVLVATGIQKVKHRRLVLTAMIVECCFLNPMGFPIMGKTIPDSQVLEFTNSVDLPTATRLLRLPVQGPNVVFQEGLYEQTIHNQPLWLNPNRPDLRSWLKLTTESEWLEQVAYTQYLTGECVPKGVGGILVKEPFVGRVSTILGVPSMTDDNYALWLEVPYCSN